MQLNKKYTANKNADFIMNTIHAYQNFQDKSNDFSGIALDYVYEFTAHLFGASGSVHNIQLQLDKICSELQKQISRQLLGKSYTVNYKQKYQPMLVAGFDYEGTRQGRVLDRCEVGHLHGIIVFHPQKQARFDKVFYKTKKERYNLFNLPPEFTSFSIIPIDNGIQGLSLYAGYSIKQSQLDIKTDNNYFVYHFYPRTKLWLQYLNDLPREHLEHYKNGSFH